MLLGVGYGCVASTRTRARLQTTNVDSAPGPVKPLWLTCLPGLPPSHEQEAVEAASRGTRNVAQLSQQSLPPIRLQVVKVASEVRRARGRCW